MKIRQFLLVIQWILNTQYGLDPIRFLKGVARTPGFIRDYFSFRKQYSGTMTIRPCLHDASEQGGSAHGEYFWQDILVAKMIYNNNPDRHVDVGSRFDGFVAHVASFRELEVLDIRPIAAKVPGVRFSRADLMNMPDNYREYCDSISCLHAIEHFGLGRYGDPINPSGYQSGIRNLTSMLVSGGTLYLSTPVGRERVDFNSSWIFSTSTILQEASANGLALQKAVVIHPNGNHVLHEGTSIDLTPLDAEEYNLCVFIFVKRRNEPNISLIN